ncbi:hypothetical protein ACHAQJ_000857 [Trichoderma viride]
MAKDLESSTNLPEQPAKLCDLCQGVSFDDGKHQINRLGSHALGKNEEGLRLPISTVRNDDLPELPALQSSAEKGCDFCSFLRIVLLKRQPSRALKKVQIRLTFIWRTELDYTSWYGLTALEVALYSEDGSVDCQIVLDISSDDKSVANWLQIAAGPKADALCDENVQMLRSEIERCSRTCHPLGAAIFFPTRVVDVGQDGVSCPRLIVAADDLGSVPSSARSELRYATLSYCWGTNLDASTQFKTTTETLDEHRKSMPLTSMSQVMRDAVSVCRRLSIDYLWIDAVCILQDDEADWNAESQKMGLIYKNATVTICAAATTSCHESFLDRKHLQTYPRINIPFSSTMDPTIAGTFSLWDRDIPKTMEMNKEVVELRHKYFIKDALYLQTVLSSWATRGWVYQERLLSTRMLLFGEDFVHFHCPEGSVSENGISLSASFETSLVERTDDPKVQSYLGQTIYERWRDLSYVYASLSLTQPTDRFPALSGLARHFADLVSFADDEYLAGLWRRDFLRELLWVRAQPISEDLQHLLRHIQAPEQYVAPSWSWATQDSACSIDVGRFSIDSDTSGGRGRRSEVQQLAASVDIDGLNVFGKIRGGRIRLQGKIVSVVSSLVQLVDAGNLGWSVWKIMDQGKYTAHCQLDWKGIDLEQEPVQLEMLPLMSVCSDRDTFYMTVDDKDSGFDDTVETALAGHDADNEVVEMCDICNLPDHNRHAWGLLLYPSGEPDIYYRVGVFTSRAPKAHTGWHFGTNLFRGANLRDIEIR